MQGLSTILLVPKRVIGAVAGSAILATLALGIVGSLISPAGGQLPPPVENGALADGENHEGDLEDIGDPIPPPEEVVVPTVLVSSFQCFASQPNCQVVNAVLKYDAMSGAYLGPHITSIPGPTGIAQHPVTGRLLVASRPMDLVNEYDRHSGAFIRTFVPSGSGELNVPQHILFHPNGNLLVTSTQTDGSLFSTNGIIEYNGSTGAFVRIFKDGGFLGEDCGDPRCLYGPNTMAWGSNGHLYVTSGNNDLILEYDVNGNYINYFDSGSLKNPNGLVIRPATGFRPNNLLVTSLFLNPANPSDTHKVLEFDDVTHELITTGSGILASGFDTPGPLLFASDGNLLVGDRAFWEVPPNYSDRIIKRNSQTGAFVSFFTPTNNFALHYSTGMLPVTIGCTTNADCNDANPCTDDVCNTGNNTCSNTPDDTNTPNDGLFCNGTEESCSAGQVIYSMPPPNCNDGFSCTTDGCNEAQDQCTHTVLPGFCLVAGACRIDGEVNPGSPCQACNAGANQNNWTNLPVGTLCGSTVDNECDNPDRCNAAGTCLTNFEPAGTQCGSALDSACTNPDTCSGNGACLNNHAANGTSCDDTLFCTSSSACSNGFCIGSGNPCNTPQLPLCLEQDNNFLCVQCAFDEDCPNDALFCTSRRCNVMTHTCSNVPDNTICNDNMFCNGVETCDGGTGNCIAGTNPCPAGDGCDETLDHCVECGVNADCTDGLFCNGPESCAFGLCKQGNLIVNNGGFNGQTGWTNNIPVHGNITYPNNLRVVGPNSMDPGFTWASQGGLNFLGGNLEFDLLSYSNPGDTADWDYPVLRIDSVFFGLNSNGTLGGITFGDNEGAGTIDNGHPAENVHFIIDIEAVAGPGVHSIGFGVCSVDGEFGGAVAVYDNVFGLVNAGSPCEDACNEANDTCINCVNNIDCSDGLFCNGNETCVSGQCLPGTNPCGAGLMCLEASDQCVQCINNANCNDNLFCNGQETCVSGFCQAGTSPCLQGQMCNEANDQCTGCGTSAQCDDGNPCNGAETCQSGMCMPGTPIPNCCTSNAQCTNNNVCDGNETCVAGNCIPGSPLNCNDNRPCTTDACHPIGGCQHSNLPAGSACGDQTSTQCDLPNTCNPIGDCQANVLPNNTPCPDGITCNGNELCSSGVCQPGTPIPNCCNNNGDCNNGNPCDGVETCVGTTCQAGTPVPGCCFNNSDCSNNNVCDGVETCVSNACVAGTPLACNDGNACTQDSCNAISGCQNMNLPAGTQCGSQSNSACDHPDSCDANGVCQANLESNGTPCPDGLVCNGSESCQAGVCTPGTPVPGCCTSNAECNNNNVCDGTETCVSNACVAGTSLVCNDGNPCTDNNCNATLGCQFPNNNLPCEDGDECTAFDMCANGQCVGGPPADCTNAECTDCNDNHVRDDCEELADCDNNTQPDACEPVGDGDADCDVDLYDIGPFQGCFSGTGLTLPACYPYDINDDGKVDLVDWAMIHAGIEGP